MYAALNAIGEVAWCINRPVLDALKHAGDRGMQIGSMPPVGDLPLRDTPQGQRIRGAAGAQMAPGPAARHGAPRPFSSQCHG